MLHIYAKTFNGFMAAVKANDLDPAECYHLNDNNFDLMVRGRSSIKIMHPNRLSKEQGMALMNVGHGDGVTEVFSVPYDCPDENR